MSAIYFNMRLVCRCLPAKLPDRIHQHSVKIFLSLPKKIHNAYKTHCVPILHFLHQLGHAIRTQKATPALFSALRLYFQACCFAFRFSLAVIRRLLWIFKACAIRMHRVSIQRASAAFNRALVAPYVTHPIRSGFCF